MPIEVLNRGAKQLYEELYLQNTQRQLFYQLFSTVDESESGSFLLDSLIQSPYAVTYRQKNGQSHVREYSAGSGQLIEVPIASEKTPITEELLDKVVAGVEANAEFTTNEAKLLNDIMRQHIAAVNMTKNWQALQVLVDGKFYAKGPGGVDIGLDIDYSRASANSLTPDFTGSDDIGTAFKAALDQGRSQGMPMSNVVAILGDTWVSTFGADSDVQTFMQNNMANPISRTDLFPPELLGIEGLYVIGQYRDPSMVAGIWVCGYKPPVQFVKDEGETAEDYIADAEAVFFSLDDIRYRVNRGVNVIGENGRKRREVGDVVFDTFTDNDPVAENLRSNTRHVFVPGNKNHTVKSTGEF